MSNYIQDEHINMTSKLDFNLMNFLTSYTKQLRIALNSAYPDNHFKESNGHTAIQMAQSLSRSMSKYCESLKEEVNGNTNLEANEKTLLNNTLNYLDRVSERIRNVLEKTYPDNYYSADKAHLYITQAFALVITLEDYQEIHKDSFPLMKINMTNVLRKPFDYKGIIKRAYPNDQFSETTCHEALQRLRQTTIFAQSFVTNIRNNNEPAENDFNLKNHKLPEKTVNYLKDLNNQLVELNEAALIAYPNSYLNVRLGHTAFTECIRKINQITKLIAENTDKNDLVKIINDRDNKVVAKEPEEFKTKEELEKVLTPVKKEDKGFTFKF